jgi:hypothetical protein
MRRLTLRKGQVALTGTVVMAIAVAGLAVFAFVGHNVHAGGTGGGCNVGIGAPVNGGASGTSTPTDPSIHCNLKGSTVQVSFQQTDNTGCVVTSIGVMASESVSRSSTTGMTSFGPYLWVSEFQYALPTDAAGDPCSSPSSLLSVWGQTPDATYTGDPGLGSAHVSGTLTLSGADYVTGNNVTLSDVPVDLIWKAVGPSSRIMDASHWHSPDFILSMHYNAATRTALASGILTIEGTNYASGATVGSLSEVDSGQLDIVHT